MLKVGLTGGLACGKTFVGEALASCGGQLIVADQLGHQVLAPGGEAYDEVVREFGRGILNGDGVIDRRALAARVFDSPDCLARLNALVHPAVVRREERLMAELAARDPHGIAIVEAAILIENGSYTRFDRIVLVTCTPEQQVERALRREGSDEKDVRERLSRQMGFEQKRQFAHFIVDTSTDKENTLRQARGVYEALRRIES